MSTEFDWSLLDDFVLENTAPPPPPARPVAIVHLMVKTICLCGRHYRSPKFIGTTTFLKVAKAKGNIYHYTLSPYMGGHSDLPIETETEYHTIRHCPECFEPKELAPISNVATTPTPIQAIDQWAPAAIATNTNEELS